jgi:hypothetical protein
LLLGNRLPTVVDDWAEAIGCLSGSEHLERETEISTRSRVDNFGYFCATASRSSQSPPIGQSVPDVIGKYAKCRSSHSSRTQIASIDETERFSTRFERKSIGKTAFDSSSTLAWNGAKACDVRPAAHKDTAFGGRRSGIDKRQPQVSPSELRDSHYQHQQPFTDDSKDAYAATDEHDDPNGACEQAIL